jgi:hypothetical protein
MIANAPIPVSSDSNVQLVLISAGVVLVVAIFGFIPLRLAQSRGHRHRDLMLAIIVLWGLALAGSISYSIMQQMDWSANYQQRLVSGYGDPSDLSDKPKIPLVLWGGLTATYVGLLAWASRSTAAA